MFEKSNKHSFLLKLIASFNSCRPLCLTGLPGKGPLAMKRWFLAEHSCETVTGRFSRTKRNVRICKKCVGEQIATEEHVLGLECRRCYHQKFSALSYLIELLKNDEVIVAEGCTLPDCLPLLQKLSKTNFDRAWLRMRKLFSDIETDFNV